VGTRLPPIPLKSSLPRLAAMLPAQPQTAEPAVTAACIRPTTRPGTHLDECVQLLVTADGQLQVAGGDTLHLRGQGGVVVGVCACHACCVDQLISSKPTQTGAGAAGNRRKKGGAAPACLQVLGGVASQLEHLGGEVLCREGGAAWRLCVVACNAAVHMDSRMQRRWPPNKDEAACI